MNRRGFLVTFLSGPLTAFGVPRWEVTTHMSPSITCDKVRRPDIFAWTLDAALDKARERYPTACRWIVDMPEPSCGWDNWQPTQSHNFISTSASNPPRLRELGRWTPYWVARVKREVDSL